MQKSRFDPGRLSLSMHPSGTSQDIFVLEPRKLCIDIEIEIVIEIDFWQLSDFDSDSGDFDFNGRRPSLGSPHERHAI
jgi:hypothetical protein